MRVLVDIVHPAHVHFYRYMIEELEARGHDVMVASRDKDVTLQLLDDFGIAHRPISSMRGSGRLRQAGELVQRDLALLGLARRFRPDVILTRNPSGVQVARLSGAVGIFDTDDGSEAGLLWHAAAPFAHIITSPEATPGVSGSRHRPYPAYKAMAYLHPDRRKSLQPPARELLGLDAITPFFVMRLVAMSAAHDKGESGLRPETAQALAARLRQHGRLFISSEAALPSELREYRLDVPASRFHDVLEEAALVVCDSQTVAAEAALLATPVVHVSTFAGRLGYLDELNHRYGLVSSHRPGDEAQIMAATTERLRDLVAAGKRQHQLRSRLLDDQIDLVAWYMDLLEEIATA